MTPGVVPWELGVAHFDFDPYNVRKVENRQVSAASLSPAIGGASHGNPTQRETRVGLMDAHP